MDAINVYLDNMFLNLPRTERVMQVKQELGSSMEARYLELRRQGRTENEAVGQVIAELGDIRDLETELSLGESDADMDGEIARRILTRDQAMRFLTRRKHYSRRIALGVAVLILAALPLTILTYLAEAEIIGEEAAMIGGIAMLFILLAFGVGLLILTGIKSEKEDELEHDYIVLDRDTRENIALLKDESTRRFAGMIAGGVVLIVAAAGFTAIAGLIEGAGTMLMIAAVIVLALSVAAAVALFILAGTERSSYDILLNRGEYTLAKRRSSSRLENLAGIYWVAVTALYLGWSFISGRWGITWIVWPIAAVIYALAAQIVQFAEDRRGR